MARQSASDALNHPTSFGQREIHSSDLPLRALEDLEDEDRTPDIITCTEKMADGDYAAELAFMEEEVEIILRKGREKFAPLYEMFGVDGKTLWVMTDRPTKLKRKYLEVMARSQPMDIRTESGEDVSDALTFNRTQRHLSSNFSFSVIKDPSPKGGAWLAKLMRES